MIFVTSFDHSISSGAKRITVSPGLPGAFAARGEGRAGAGMTGEDKNGAKNLDRIEQMF
jgi:hypothetical protein